MIETYVEWYWEWGHFTFGVILFCLGFIMGYWERKIQERVKHQVDLEQEFTPVNNDPLFYEPLKWPSDERIDNISRNGNDGLHYEDHY